MNCPYCAEEIKDEATFCRHCNHDFGLVKPLFLRVIALEKKVATSVNRPLLPALEATPFYQFSTSAVAVLLSVAYTSGFFLVMAYSKKPSQNLSAYVLSIILPPAVFGLLNGLVSVQRSTRDYSLAGLSVGALNLLLLWGAYHHPQAHFQWTLTILAFPIGQSFTFASLSLLGNSLRNRSTDTGSGGTSVLKDANTRLILFADTGKAIASLCGNLGLAYVFARTILEKVSP